MEGAWRVLGASLFLLKLIASCFLRYAYNLYASLCAKHFKVVTLQGLYIGLGRVHAHRVPNRVPYVMVRYNNVPVPVQVYICTVPPYRYRTVRFRYSTVQYGTVRYRFRYRFRYITVPYRMVPVSYGTKFVPSVIIVRYGTKEFHNNFSGTRFWTQRYAVEF